MIRHLAEIRKGWTNAPALHAGSGPSGKHPRARLNRLHMSRGLVLPSAFIFALLIVPIAVSGISFLLGDRHINWRTADRSSAGLLPDASRHVGAVIRVYAARTVRWRGIFAVHSW